MSIRNRVSTLKHTIRHQQAQLQTLENTLRRSPTPSSSPVKSASNSASDLYPERHSNAAAPGTISDSFSLKTQRRTSSFEILQNMAGPESLLPLPRKDGLGGLARTDSIREGVPADFNMDSLNTSQTRRTSSPTRTLSRELHRVHSFYFESSLIFNRNLLTAISQEYRWPPLVRFS